MIALFDDRTPKIGNFWRKSYATRSLDYVLRRVTEEGYPQSKDAQKKTALKAIIEWTLTTGKSSATKLGYLPLDDKLRTKAKQNSIKLNKLPKLPRLLSQYLSQGY